MGKCTIVVGAQWGDEGKGKVVDLLSEDADIVARFQGGGNAGHTIVIGSEKYVLHQVPSGIIHPKTRCIIGNGMVLDPYGLMKELEMLKKAGVNYEGRLFISGATNLVLPYHKALDVLGDELRGASAIGTTGRGIGPAYVDKANRCGIRLADLLDDRDGYKRLKDKLEANRSAKAYLFKQLLQQDQISWDDLPWQLIAIAEILRPMMADVSLMLAQACQHGQAVLMEGAQGGLLDVDLGTYPYATSSNTTSGGALTGLGIGPCMIDEVTGVVKAYTTRVGNGPFPTELADSIGESLREGGGEYGATTGRPRRCGWLDLVLLKHACRINGVTSLAITKIDVLDGFKEIEVCTGYVLDGQVITEVPTDISRLGECQPIYKTLPGWNGEKTNQATSLDDFPQNAINYINFICKELGVRLLLISTGPDREHTIMVSR